MLLAELLFVPGVRTPLHPFEEQFAWGKRPLILSQTFQQQCPLPLCTSQPAHPVLRPRGARRAAWNLPSDMCLYAPLRELAGCWVIAESGQDL